jgi:GT2 family glycosyltransferase
MNPEQFEIVVVDDGSRDDTAQVCDIMRGALPNMLYVATGNNVGLGRATNLGIQSTKGERLLFTDDDCIPEQDWVERMCVALERRPIVAGAVTSPDSNYIKLCHNIAEFHRFMPGRKAGEVEFVAGANMGIVRSLLEELGGFQEGRAVAGDMELILRARLKGYRVHLKPDAVVTHDPERTDLRTVLGYSAGHARTTVLLRNEYRSLLRTPFVLRSSVLVLLASPLIALKVTIGIYLTNFRLARLLRTLPLVCALKLAWCWGAARGLREQKRGGIRS